MILKNPQLLVNFVGQTIPSVSLYFVDMVIVKIFTAVPLEMIRPWQVTKRARDGDNVDNTKNEQTYKQARVHLFIYFLYQCCTKETLMIYTFTL